MVSSEQEGKDWLISAEFYDDDDKTDSKVRSVGLGVLPCLALSIMDWEKLISRTWHGELLVRYKVI